MNQSDRGLLLLWIALTAMSLLVVAAVLVWAVRSGQFHSQQHARRLPLMRELPGSAERDCLARSQGSSDGEGK